MFVRRARCCLPRWRAFLDGVILGGKHLRFDGVGDREWRLGRRLWSRRLQVLREREWERLKATGWCVAKPTLTLADLRSLRPRPNFVNVRMQDAEEVVVSARKNECRRQVGRIGSTQTKMRCLETRGVAMYRLEAQTSASAWLAAGLAWCHHSRRARSSLFSSRSGKTNLRTCSNGHLVARSFLFRHLREIDYPCLSALV